MATPKKRTKRGWQRDRTGCVVVQFTAPDGKRRTLRLGNIPDKDAVRHVSMLQTLIATLNVGGSSDAKLAAQIESWLTGIGPKIGDKLVEFGLLRPLAAAESTQLGPFLDRYLALRTDVKPTTATAFTFTQRNLVAFFGYDRDITTINKLEAREFRAHLQKTKLDGGESLAANTMRRRVTMASQFFNAAVEAGIIEKNPFRGVGEAVRANKARMYFLTADDAAKVLAACPSAEWKLVFGLARWGGLRIPSEINELKWEDFDWAGGKFLVHSPKTEHHEGKECRWVPIFDELYPIVREAWEKAEPGDVYVLNRYRNHTNLATGFKIIVKRSGLKQWPKTFQNLRSTRETELMAIHPIDKVCEWIGNTPLIAMKHYKQQRDVDFIQVARLSTDAERGPLKHVPGRDEFEPDQSLAMALQSGTDGGCQEGSGEFASVGVESGNCESSAILGPSVASGGSTVYDNAAVWQRFCLPVGPPLCPCRPCDFTAMRPQTIVIRAENAPVEEYDWGTLQWIVNGRRAPGSEQTFGVSTIRPGRRNPLHYHPNCEEILYVVSGTCEHSYDGATAPLTAGETIVIPSGVKHNLVNTGEVDVVCVISFSSPDRETVFLE